MPNADTQGPGDDPLADDDFLRDVLEEIRARAPERHGYALSAEELERSNRPLQDELAERRLDLAVGELFDDDGESPWSPSA